jgi:hypothetical protein
MSKDLLKEVMKYGKFDPFVAAGIRGPGVLLLSAAG